MAKCPKCGKTQDWWKLLKFDRTRLMVCQGCGSLLALDAQRSIILLGGFVAILALPFTSLLAFDWNSVWFLAVSAAYAPFYIAYTKLIVVSDDELKSPKHLEADVATYRTGRRRINLLGYTILTGGLLAFLAGMSLSSLQTSETVAVIGLIAMTVGLGTLALTKCPYCKQWTVRIPFGGGARCINCHRDLDLDE